MASPGTSPGKPSLIYQSPACFTAPLTILTADEVSASTDTDAGDDAPSPASPIKIRILKRELSVSISEDLVNIVDRFLHPPVALDFKDIQVIAEDKMILQNASGSVRPGQLLAIMGPSGAGKTSLLNAIIGETGGCKVGGSVHLNGNISTDPLRSREAAFVAQQGLFYEELTVNEIMYYAAELQLAHAPKSVREVSCPNLIYQSPACFTDLSSAGMFY